MKHDPAISTLLDLHGSIFDQGNGYWIKIEAWPVDISKQIPHEIQYSLTIVKNTQQLLEDFFADIDDVLSEVSKP